jgi:hypothetical protein
MARCEGDGAEQIYAIAQRHSVSLAAPVASSKTPRQTAAISSLLAMRAAYWHVDCFCYRQSTKTAVHRIVLAIAG